MLNEEHCTLFRTTIKPIVLCCVQVLLLPNDLFLKAHSLYIYILPNHYIKIIVLLAGGGGYTLKPPNPLDERGFSGDFLWMITNVQKESYMPISNDQSYFGTIL